MQSNLKQTISSIAPGLSSPLPSWTPKETIPFGWNSIFIPRIDFEITRQELINIIENKLVMGHVSRIDFAPANNGSGRMAFIHMVEFTNSPYVDAIRREMETIGFWELPDDLQKYFIKIRFVINKNPVPKTDFTMETLADAVARQGYAVEENTLQVESINDQIVKIAEVLNIHFDAIEGNHAELKTNNSYIRQTCEQNFQQLNSIEERLTTIEAEKDETISILKKNYLQERERANKVETELSQTSQDLANISAQLANALKLLQYQTQKMEETETRFQQLEHDMVVLYDKIN
jgi:hypothetical protein